MAGKREEKGESKATAIELKDSGSETEDEVEEVKEQDDNSNGASTTPASKPSNLAALLGDRAQMERERLERQKKRKRELGIADDDEDQQEQGTAKKMPSAASIPQVSQNRSAPQQSVSASPLYWDGIIKVSGGSRMLQRALLTLVWLNT
jgi:hypothetical protein